jgi:DnaJ-class molecular chaperone
MDAKLVLPIASDAETLLNGGMESLILGDSKFEVKIPPGSRIGQKFRMKGMAGRVDSSLEGGDIHLLVTSDRQEILQVKRDVHLELPMSYNKMIRGSVHPMTIGEKRIEVKIPSGIQMGQKLRLRGMAEHLNGGHEGDVILLLREDQETRWFSGLFSGFGRPDKQTVSVNFNVFFLTFEYSCEWVTNFTRTQIVTNQSNLI